MPCTKGAPGIPSLCMGAVSITFSCFYIKVYYA